MARMTLRLMSLLMGTLVGNLAGNGAAAELVIDRMPLQIEGGSAPSQFIAINNILYFVAQGSHNNAELWRTNGTNAGTHLVREINPRGSRWGAKSRSNPQDLFNWNGTLYFTAETPETGRELWKSDGTDAGTVMVKDTAPGPKAGITSDPHFVDYRGELYFVANRALFKTDGTLEGTIQIGKDGGITSPLSNITDIEVAGDHLYFHSQALYGQFGIWRFDDGPAGLIQVSPPNNYAWNDATELTNVAGTLFCAIDRNKTLAKVGTTTNSAVLLTDATLNRVSGLTAFAGKIAFYAKHPGDYRAPSGIWISNGTSAGTVPLLEAAGGEIGAKLAVVNNLLFFSRNDDEGASSIVVSDGTVAGTRLLVAPGGDFYTPFNGEIYYMTGFVLAGDHYTIMYKTNGTQEGTVRVNDQMYTGRDSGFGVLGNRLFFGGTTQSWGGVADLWSLPAATGNASLFKTLGVEGEPSIDSDDTGVAFKGKYYYTDRWKAPDTYNNRVTVTNGTAAGTMTYSNTHADVVGTVNNRLLISDAQGNVSSSVSGVTGDEEVLAMKYYAAGNGGLDAFVPWGNRALVRGTNVYVTDGTPAGTLVLLNSSQSSYRWDMTPLNNSTALLRRQDYNSANGDIGNAMQLWATDGSVAGTVKIIDLPGHLDIGAVMVSTSGYGYMPVYRDRNFGQGTAKLWRTDGTMAGTLEISGSPNFTNVESIGANSTHAVFASIDHESGAPTLWSYDIAGNSFTNLQAVFPTGRAVVFNDVIYFAGNDGVHGVELWQSDGTPGGTFMVNDFMPGSNSSFPTQLSVIQDILFMVIDHPNSGYELAAMRKTDSKPWLVDNLNSGRKPSTPNNLNVSTDGNRLYMFADNGSSGQELFKLDINGLIPYTAATDWSLYE